MEIHPLSLKERGIEWFKKRAHGTYAKAWLFFFSFTESSFLFFTPDILLIAILLAGSSKWLYYSILTTVASVLGAIFGYAVAVFFFDSVGINIVNFYNISDEVELVRGLFSQNSFFVIFTAAFTPIPYKVFVLAAGFLKINFFTFLIASIMGRGLRYLIVAYSVHILRDRAVSFLARYSVIVTVAVVVLIIVFVLKTLF